MLDHQATGTVVLEEPDGTQHTAYFENGAAAKVRTGHPIALLGELLVADGQIDPNALETARQTAHEIGTLIGEYLIVDGLASRKAVIRALDNQVTAKIVGLANLPDDAQYAFYADTNFLTNWAGDDLFPTHALSVILAVARVWLDRRRIRGALNKISNRPLRLHPECDISRVAATDADVAVISAITQGSLSLRQLHERFPAFDQDIDSLVYALAITRQFHLGKNHKPPMRVGGSRKSQLDIPVNPSYVIPVGSEPNNRSLPTAEPSSPPAPAPKFKPKPLAEASAPQTRAKAQGTRGPLPTSPKQDNHAHAPIGPAASLASANIPRPRPVAPPPLPPAAPAAASPVPPIARPPASPPRTDGEILRASEDFHAAMDALKRGDFGRAEQLVQRAAKTVPDVPEHAALAAWIRASASSHPEAMGEAIVTLTNILKEQPGCELALLYRAKILRRAGKGAAALVDIDHILALNPGHREAQAEARLLRSLRRPGS